MQLPHSDTLSEKRIKEELDTLGVKYPEIAVYKCTDSTNTRAIERAEESSEDCIFIAEEQTAGRGRRGRSFSSPEGAGIYMSFLTHGEAEPEAAVGITAYAAVKVCLAVESLTDTELKIKWVNDVYLKGRKLAGILTEGAFDERGKLRYTVCGIGINVHKGGLTEELRDIAISLEEGAEVRVDRNVLAARIIKEFLEGFGNFRDKSYHAEYTRRSFLVGKQVTVHKLSESYPAKVKAVLEDYSLLLDREGEEERLFTGEVSVREADK